MILSPGDEDIVSRHKMAVCDVSLVTFEPEGGEGRESEEGERERLRDREEGGGRREEG